MRFYNTLKKTSAFVLVLLLCMIGANFGCLLYLNGKSYDDRWEFRSKRPAAYKNSEYFCGEFLNESKQMEGAGYFDGPIIKLREFKGNYGKIVNGKRATLISEPARNKLFVFGGSTIFSAEVPDNLTIPSILQSKINDRKFGFEVVNMGVSAMNISQQLYLLKETDIKPGDIVVFYFGVNDALYNVYYGYESGLNEEIWKAPKNYSIYEQSVKLLSWLGLDGIVNVLNYTSASVIPVTIKSESILKKNVASSSFIIANASQTAKEYVETRGGLFYSFLQPNLFTKDKHSKYEYELIGNPYLVPRGYDIAVSQLYAQLQIQNSLGDKAMFVDISPILNAKDQEFYFDFCHVNEFANRIVADEIFNNIFTKN